MVYFLKTKYTKPIEREYEAWIVASIEAYFKSLEIPFAIWAVSPDDETIWPADEQLTLGGKIIGLQFKKANMAAGQVSFGRLNWTLHSPSPQFNLVKNNKDVYYCLPTFINRDVRAQALHHCLFWRPRTKVNKNVWYKNPRSPSPYKEERESMRWGLFIETVLSCKIGTKISNRKSGNLYLKKFYSDLKNRIKEYENLPKNTDDDARNGGLYLAVIGLEPTAHRARRT